MAFILLIPQVTFASWWNPFTWNIFGGTVKTQVQQIGVATTTVKIANQDFATSTKKISNVNKNHQFTKKTSNFVIATTTTNSNISTTTVAASSISIETNSTSTIQTQSNTQSTTTIAEVQNTVLCNGSNYSPVCPTGQHFFCPTNGSTAQCLTADANYCNGTGWNACPSGQIFSCSSTGGVCSAPSNSTLCNGTYWTNCPYGQNFVCPISGNAFCQTPQQPIQKTSIQNVQTIITPPVPQGPSYEQKQAECQKSYDLAYASLQLSYQSQSAQIEANYEQDLANMQDRAGQNGTYMGGGERALEQSLLATRDRTLASITAQYGLNVSNEKMTLQECLNN